MRVLTYMLLLLSTACYGSNNPGAAGKGSNNGKVHEFKLSNGLRLIVKEDHRSPVVVSQVWYKVGSSYEHNGVTGVSHILEHMMFQGTKRLKPNEFSHIISRNGGRENAFTGRDYTAYFQRLEKSRLHVSFKWEADRMQGLSMRDKEFQKERKVVIEERRLRTEDKPTSLTYEKFMATAFQNSPYRTPVIGWMNDLENMKMADLARWYKRWYAPNNAIVVVVGDVKPAAVLALAKKHFGPLKPVKLRPPKPQVEVRQTGIKRVVVKAPARLPYLMMGYKVPSVRTAKDKREVFALEVMAYVLDGGRSARLKRALVREQQIAASVDASYSPYSRLSTQFMLYGVPAQGKTVGDVEKGIRAQIGKLKKVLVSNKELDRVKAQVVAENVYQRDSLFYQAMLIGQMETTGYTWKDIDDYVKQVRKVTPEQIRKVARKYLVDDALTVATLDPQPIKPGKRKRAAVSGGRHGH